MSLMSEYINRKMTATQYEEELLKLIGQYNKLQNSFLVVYAGAITKATSIPYVNLDMDDYYILFDMLKDLQLKKIDIYIETPGGSAEAVEEIIRFFRNEFEDVCISFVISGEAKSAGTIMVLGGDEILMTRGGSLGPIDAQMKIGRSTISAYDYDEWIKEKREEAEKNKALNAFDAVMVAQISPGEVKLVTNALYFAKDLVIEWLPKYKFKNWEVTETQGNPVTPKMKEDRATEIADLLCNHEMWRSHGRSLKIDDLINKVGLKIQKVDDDPKLADCVYRIQTVIRMLFTHTNSYKIFATDREKIFKQASARGEVRSKIPQMPKAVKPSVTQIEVKCPKCQKIHKLYAKLEMDDKIDRDFQKKGLRPYPKSNKLVCDCGFEYDLVGMRNAIENKIGKKFVI